MLSANRFIEAILFSFSCTSNWFCTLVVSVMFVSDSGSESNQFRIGGNSPECHQHPDGNHSPPNDRQIESPRLATYNLTLNFRLKSVFVYLKSFNFRFTFYSLDATILKY